MADIDVTPDPRDPIIVIGGEIPAPSAPNTPVPVQNPTPNDEIQPPIVGCRVDEITGIYGCPTTTPPDPGEPRPEPTEGDILRATRTIGLPSLQIKIQPGDETLVNIPTVLYAEPRQFARSVTLLGYEVDLTAAPVSYLWMHGDGTQQETHDPGRPYPAMDVTHRYVRPADDVRPRVDVTYRVRYRIDGGAWQTIGQTLTASGPDAELDVAEAAPVLTKR